MDQRLACLFVLFAITKSANSYDVGQDHYFDTENVPDDIRKYLATFETRILRAVDNEFKTQLNMIRARIDYRIPSLLDLTLKDTINSGFVNKDMDEALIRRVEKLEGEVVLLSEHLQGNTTQLDEVRAKLQESESELQIINKKTFSLTSTNTAAFERLDSEMKQVQTALLAMDSKVNALISNITKDRKNTASDHFKQQEDLDRIKFELSHLNSSIVTAISDVATFDEDVQDVKSEIGLLRNNDTVKASELKELRSNLEEINLTLNNTVVDIREHTEIMRSQNTNLLQIEKHCNITNTGLEEMKIGVAVIQSAVNETVRRIQANSEEIVDLKTILQTVRETSNLTALTFDELKSELQTSVLEVTRNEEVIQQLKDELSEIRNNMTKFDLEDLALGLQKVESAVTETSVNLAAERKDIGALQAELVQMKKRVTNNTLDLKQMLSGIDTLRTIVNTTLSDVQDVNEAGYKMDKEILDMKSKWALTEAQSIQISHEVSGLGQLVSNNTEALMVLDGKLIGFTENTTITSLDVTEMKTKILDFDSRVTKMAASSTEHVSEIDSLKLELASFTQNITMIASHLSRTVSEMDQVKSDLTGVITKGNRTGLRVEELEQNLSDLTENLKGAATTVTNHSRAIQAVKAELPSIRTKIGKASSDAKANKNSITSVQTSLTSITQKVNALTPQIGSLRKDVKFEVRLSVRTKSVLTGTTVKFNKVQYNTGKAYSSLTGEFRAPVAGSFLFWANVVVHQRSSSIEIALMKNGVKIASSAAITSSTTQFDTIVLTSVAELKIGDKVLFKKTYGSTNNVFGLMYSGYGGILIRAK